MPARVRVAADYQPQFDGLRALAVLTVMVDHFSAGVPDFPLPDSLHLGAISVRLFLVLSGYFITASLRRARDEVDTRQMSVQTAIGGFYRRRALRILPAYASFTIIGLVLNLGFMRDTYPWIFTGTVNWLIAWRNDWPPAISHLWSIGVQEQFYLVWPVLIMFLPRRWILPAIVGIALTGIAFRVGCVLFHVPLIARWVLPFGSLDSLAAGAAIGWCDARLRPAATNWLLVPVGLWMLGLATMWRNSNPNHPVTVLVEPLEAGALAMLVARTAVGFSGWVGRLLSLPGLVFAGRISYGLYIYHVLVSMILDRWSPTTIRWLLVWPATRLEILGTVTVLVAAASWRYLEQPINRLRMRERPRPMPVGTEVTIPLSPEPAYVEIRSSP